MSSTILTNWTVYYSGDTGGDQQIRWTGTTGTNTLNELYSALQDLFDNSTQMDDGTAMSAQTPTAYTIGLLDAGETNPWFIDPESIKHLTGGALQTTSWKRVTGTNTGIIKLPYTVGGGSDFVSGDIGKHVDLGANDGTLLYYDSSDLICWIRPDTNAAVDDFDDAGTLSVASGTGSVTIGVSTNTTGEMIWSNIFTLGTIQDNTTIFVSQSNSVISNTEDSGSGRWWGNGHIDILVLTTNQSTLIDRGLLTIYARQYSKKYSYYSTNVSSGGRTPIPIATSDDSNNESGFRTFTGSSGTGTFSVESAIYVGTSWATATAKGILTAVSGTVSAPILTYYLIGDLTDMSSTVYEYDFVSDSRTTNCATGTPTNTGPASQALSLVFGLDQTLDVDEDSTNEDYSIIINLTSSITLATMNERLKYITRRGETATLDGIQGQQYLGIDYRVDYTTRSATPIPEGSTITQTLADTTTATTEVVAHNTTDNYLMLRDTRGTLETGGSSAVLSDGSNTVTMATGATTTIITPTIEHPFGIFAGNKFFGAHGVAVKNVPTADANNYELIDNDGNTIAPPSSISITVTGVTQNTQCYVVDSVPTEYLNAAATTNVSGDEYQATVEDIYTSDIPVTVRAREIGYLPFETSGTIVSSGLTVTAVWQVDPNFKFTVTEESIQFTNATSLITRSGNFTTDGWLSIMSQVTVTGSSSNDGAYTITAVGTTTITVSGSLSDATDTTGVTLTYTRRAPTW